MINVNPQGDVWLCKTGLKNDYKNVLTFKTGENQLAFFNSKIQHTLHEYTYIKHDSSMKVGLPIDQIMNCDYLFYANGGFHNEYDWTPYYYCFITNMEYVNENTTLITFETDVFQTWYWRIVYNPCFVEREHVNNDTIGNHTVPEGLETGNYIIDDTYYYNGLDAVYYMMQSVTNSSGQTGRKATNFGGIPARGYAYVEDSYSNLDQIITSFGNYQDQIYNVYIVPQSMVAIATRSYNGSMGWSSSTIRRCYTN